MPDHTFMYPKVVPVAVREPVAGGAIVHNFAQDKLRISPQVSGNSAEQPKTATSL
jgi:hypothetical protein